MVHWIDEDCPPKPHAGMISPHAADWYGAGTLVPNTIPAWLRQRGGAGGVWGPPEDEQVGALGQPYTLEKWTFTAYASSGQVQGAPYIANMTHAQGIQYIKDVWNYYKSVGAVGHSVCGSYQPIHYYKAPASIYTMDGVTVKSGCVIPQPPAPSPLTECEAITQQINKAQLAYDALLKDYISAQQAGNFAVMSSLQKSMAAAQANIQALKSIWASKCAPQFRRQPSTVAPVSIFRPPTIPTYTVAPFASPVPRATVRYVAGGGAVSGPCEDMKKALASVENAKAELSKNLSQCNQAVKDAENAGADATDIKAACADIQSNIFNAQANITALKAQIAACEAAPPQPPEPECSDTKPCTDPNKECFQETCVDKCPSGYKRQDDGSCAPIPTKKTGKGLGAGLGLLLLAGAAAGAIFLGARAPKLPERARLDE